MSAEKKLLYLFNKGLLNVSTFAEKRRVFKSEMGPDSAYKTVMESGDDLQVKALKEKMKEAVKAGKEATADLREDLAGEVLKDFNQDREALTKTLATLDLNKINDFLKGELKLDTPDTKDASLEDLSSSETETLALFLQNTQPESIPLLTKNLEKHPIALSLLFLSKELSGDTKAQLAGISLKNGSYKIKLDGTNVESSFTKTEKITAEFKKASSSEAVLLAFLKDLNTNPKKLSTGAYKQRNEVMTKLIEQLDISVKAFNDRQVKLREAARNHLPTEQEVAKRKKEAAELNSEKVLTKLSTLLEDNPDFSVSKLGTPRQSSFNKAGNGRLDAQEDPVTVKEDPVTIKNEKTGQYYFLYESVAADQTTPEFHLVTQVAGVDTRLASTTKIEDMKTIVDIVAQHSATAAKKELYSQKLTDRIASLRNGGELPDWTDNVEISEGNAELNDMIGDDVDELSTWNNTYNNKLTYTNRYNHLLGKLGVKTDQAKVMAKAINMGASDTSIDAGDLLEATGLKGKYGDADKFRERYTYLLKSVGKASPESEKRELQEMTEVYDSITEIISLLNQETIRETKTLSSNSEQYRFTLENLDTTTETAKDNEYLIFDGLTSDSFATEATPGHTGYKIGPSEQVLNEFEKRYDQIAILTGLEQKPYNQAQMMTLLVRLYGVEGILKHSKQNAEDSNAIVLSSLPENFTLDLENWREQPGQAVKELLDTRLAKAFKYLHEEHMGGEEPDWGDVDKPSASEVHAQKLEDLREEFNPDSLDTIRNSLQGTFSQLQASDAYEVETIVDDLVAGASPQEIQYLGEDNIRDHIKDTGARWLSSPQGIVDILTGEQKLGIKNEEPIYKVEDNGLITVDSDALTDRMNYFLKVTDKDAEQISNPNQVTPQQARLIRSGIGKYLIKEKAIQDLTISKQASESEGHISSEQYNKLKSQLTQAGYPQDQLDALPAKMKAGLALAYKYGEHMSVNGVVMVPLGENFGIGIDAGLLRDPNVGLSLGNVVKITEDTQFLTGTRLGLSGDGVSAAAFAGIRTKIYSDPETFYDTHFTAGVYGDLSKGLSVGGTIGFDAEFNEKLARNNALQKNLEQSGLLEVAKEQDTAKKVELLRTVDRYKSIQSGLADPELLAVHYADMQEIMANAASEAMPTITRTGAGVIVGLHLEKDRQAVEGGIAMGIEFRIGNRTVTVIDNETRKRLTEKLNHEELNTQLVEQTNLRLQRIADSSKIVFDEKGKLRVAKDINEASGKTSNLEKLSAAFREANLSIQVWEINGKDVLELKVLNPRGTVEIYAEGISTVTDEEGRIFLAMPNGEPLPTNLIASRARLNTLITDRNGVNSTDTIFLTTKPGKVDYQKIKDNSANLTRSTIIDGKRTAFQNVLGVDYKNALDQEKQTTNLASFLESIDNIPFSEYQQYRSIAESVPFSVDENADTVRADWTKTAKQLYFRMAEKIEKGTPPVSDFQALVKAANTDLKSRKKDPMTRAEVTSFLQVSQHLYYVDILRSKAGKEKVMARFDQHNNSIKKHNLLPRYAAAMTRLGLHNEAKPAIEVADQVLSKLIAQTRENFSAALDNINTPQDLTALPIPEGYLYSPGTFIRKNKSPLLPVTISGGQDIEGIPRLGMVGNMIEQTRESQPEVHRILLEMQNPSPDASMPETLESPYSQRLLSIPEVGHHLGMKNFKVLVDKLNGEQVNQKDFTKAMEDFGKLADKLRSQEVVTLKNGTQLHYTSEVHTAPYAQCGNFTILSKGTLYVQPLNQGLYAAVEGHKTIIPKEQFTSAGLPIPVGLFLKYRSKPQNQRSPKDPNRGAQAGRETSQGGEPVAAPNDNGVTDVPNTGSREGASPNR